MSKTPEMQERHAERIRQIMALRPRATNAFIKDALAQSDPPLILGDRYIALVRRKIEGERMHRFDRAVVTKRIAEMQDHFAEIANQLWAILLNPKVAPKDRVNAAGTLARMDKDLLEAQMDAGVFERKLGLLQTQGSLPPEHEAMVISAFQKAGIFFPRIHDITPEQQPRTQPALAGGVEAAAEGSGFEEVGDEP